MEKATHGSGKTRVDAADARRQRDDTQKCVEWRHQGQRQMGEKVLEGDGRTRARVADDNDMGS